MLNYLIQKLLTLVTKVTLSHSPLFFVSLVPSELKQLKRNLLCNWMQVLCVTIPNDMSMYTISVSYSLKYNYDQYIMSSSTARTPILCPGRKLINSILLTVADTSFSSTTHCVYIQLYLRLSLSGTLGRDLTVTLWEYHFHTPTDCHNLLSLLHSLSD